MWIIQHCPPKVSAPMPETCTSCDPLPSKPFGIMNRSQPSTIPAPGSVTGETQP